MSRRAMRRTFGPTRAWGYTPTIAAALRSGGRVDPLHFPPLARMIVVCPSGCWMWGGVLNEAGYGEIHISGRTRRAHRVVYMLARGPIPVGLTLDHLCRVHACVNPAHLEPVTFGENVRRWIRTIRYRLDLCRHGHPFDNPYITHRKNGKVERECRTCRFIKNEAARTRRKFTAASSPSFQEAS